MYSEGTQKFLEREKRRTTVRRWRQRILLAVFVVVAIWGLWMHSLDNHTFAWERSVTISVVALLDNVGGGGTDPAQDARFVQRFMSRSAYGRHNFREVEEWVQREYTRHTGDERKMFEYFLRGPVRLTAPPPALPASDASFMERLRATNRFLGYFEEISERKELLLATTDITLFIYFYDDYDESRRKLFLSYDSVATRRSRMGIIFAPINYSLLGNTCAVVAHELLHPLGASDKYDGISVYPEGYADPGQNPRYPQELAEIMALGIPVGLGRDEPVRDLQECVVGDVTAREMNWVRD